MEVEGRASEAPSTDAFRLCTPLILRNIINKAFKVADIPIPRYFSQSSQAVMHGVQYLRDVEGELVEVLLRSQSAAAVQPAWSQRMSGAWL